MKEPKSQYDILAWTESETRAYYEGVRWPDGPVCPGKPGEPCGCMDVYRIKARTRRNGKEQPERRLLRCKACKRQFTVTVGTIFEASHLPLNKWLAVIKLMCSSKKGISAHQVHRMIGVTYKTAWFMCHRIREVMREKNPGPLSGIIETDETYRGGKPRNHLPRRAVARRVTAKQRGMKNRKQRWTIADKAAVFGILERRDGCVH